MNKITISPIAFKTATRNGDLITIINFLTKQRIGKLELLASPFNYTDMSPTLKGSKYDKQTNVKFVLDFDNLTYNKVVDGESNTEPAGSVGELVGDLRDLIQNWDKNNFTKIVAFRSMKPIQFESKNVKFPSKFKNDVIEIVSTNYNNGDIIEKERRLQRLFDRNNIDYDREIVKQIFYAEYKSKGGYRPFEEYTRWIFNESKLSEYPKRTKHGVQTDYAQEIATKIGMRKDAVVLWLKQMEVDGLTILQGIGSGSIKKQDFIDALFSDEGTLKFLRKYNSDGKWSKVWKGKEISTNKENMKTKMKENMKTKMNESITEMIRRVIKEEMGERYYIAYYDRVGEHGEVGTFRDFKSAISSAKSKIKDKEFMDGLDYVGIEGTNNSLDFAILFVNEFYITRILTKNGFNSSEDYNTFISACKKYIQTGKPQIGKYQ